MLMEEFLKAGEELTILIAPPLFEELLLKKQLFIIGELLLWIAIPPPREFAWLFLKAQCVKVGELFEQYTPPPSASGFCAHPFSILQ
ncbi:MAG: hypothetical protein AMJ92_07820 [candidate division Zixibacteria bacterium SM23_81]|nr:MAG: hypothetical protein AMJ92_07820 [candidate division Zixibacteria bacterium SM23_81]